MYLRQESRNIFRQLRIPAIPILPEQSIMPAGHRARFIYPNLGIEISRQLVDSVADDTNTVKVWNALNAIRHEVHHYHQYLKGVRDFTERHEEEAKVVGRAYADEIIRSLSTDEINPTQKATKSLIICPRCGVTYTTTPSSKISSCSKCGYKSNPASDDIRSESAKVYYSQLIARARRKHLDTNVNVLRDLIASYLSRRGLFRSYESARKWSTNWIAGVYKPSKHTYEQNPILAELGASALAGFGLAAGWKGFEWGLKKLTDKRKAKKNPWMYPWQRKENPVKIIKYLPTLDIRNIAMLPRGTGARYLVAIQGQGDKLIAKRWVRVAPKSLGNIEILIDMRKE